MVALQLLAQEGLRHKNLWNPTILGILVVLSAVGLFCGSVYLLLSTNLGARLGFLVASACLSGFMVLLTLLWLTSGTPIDPPHGHAAQWSAVEVVDSPRQSKIPAVRDILKVGHEADDKTLLNLRPAMDAALVTAAQVAGETPPPQPLAKFGASTDYLTDFGGHRTFIEGGGTRNIFWHYTRYAVAELCPVRTGVTPAVCDPLAGTQFAVLKYNWGDMRKPPAMYLVAAIMLFGLSLLGLHWHERDARARRRAALTPVPTG